LKAEPDELVNLLEQEGLLQQPIEEPEEEDIEESDSGSDNGGGSSDEPIEHDPSQDLPNP